MTDRNRCGGHRYGRNLEGLALMVTQRTPTLAALASPIGSAAGVLGTAEDVGTVLPGKRADLTFFAGDITNSHDVADVGSRLTDVLQSVT
jgi:imidazolonepropionase-like amidohydrolase